jgi:uncharacterized membrane protein
MALARFRRPVPGVALLFATAGLGILLFATVSVPRRGETQAAYQVVDLGALDQGVSHIVRRLSDTDEVVGGTRAGGRRRGFILGRGPAELLDPPAGSDFVAALAIDRAGGVVVGSTNTPTSLRAFRQRRGQGGEILAPLPGDTGSEALGVNGQRAVGYSSGPSGARAVAWLANGAVELLGTLPGGTNSRAEDVNAAGDAVGTSDSPGGKRAVLWPQSSPPLDLGTLPGHTESQAGAINARGEVIGQSGGPGGSLAFVWTSQAGMRALGTPAGQTSRALGIGPQGDVVGAAGGRAVLWPGGGPPRDLSTLIPPAAAIVLTEALDINARGVILAIGRTDDGHTPAADGHGHAEESPLRIVLLVPTP